jgi:adenine phosphoribosyltransferase
MRERIPGLFKKYRKIKNFPKKGVIYWDITTFLKDKDTFRSVIDAFVKRYKNKKIDLIASIESRGYIFGSAVAYLLGAGFIMIRKKGKLPYKTIEENYEKEYGLDTIQIHKDTVKKGSRVVIVDDLLATGSTSKAACSLIERLGGIVYELAYVVEFVEFGAQEKLKDYKLFSLLKCREDE